MNLKEPCFRPFPLRTISPRGWLARQLRIQADGLSGHLDEFWTDVKDSAWIGGRAEGWERMPYWLDGVIPLAWLTEDNALKRRITGYLDYIVGHQHEDGWLGPRAGKRKEAADLWSQALALMMLVGYYDATGDDRIPGVVDKALRLLDRLIDFHPLEVGERAEDEDMVFRELPIEATVFSPETPPVAATVRGRRVPAWAEKNGSAGPVPSSPVQTDEPPENLVLLPYGCTNLRIAEFPVVAKR